MASVFAAIHHLAVLTLLVCALVSIFQLRQHLNVSSARLLGRIDMCNGAAATLVLVVGLVRVVYFEKGAAYYFASGPFLVKLGFYGLASVLSIVPSLEIRRWRGALGHGNLPDVSPGKLSTLRNIAYAQLGCLFAMAVCANLAAQGRTFNWWGSAG